MFSENLRKYRELKGLTQETVAHKLSVITGGNFIGSNIRSYENGTNPKLETIYALAQILEVPVQYLFDDSQKALSKIADLEIVKDPDRYKKNFLSPSEIRGVKKVPICEGSIDASCLDHLLSSDNIDFVYIDMYSIKRQFRNKETRAIIMLGDSMSPYANDSDIILFMPLKNLPQHFQDGKYIIEKNNAIMLKSLTFKTNGGVIITSENPEYPKEELTRDEYETNLKVVGIVVGRHTKS